MKRRKYEEYAINQDKEAKNEETDNKGVKDDDPEDVRVKQQEEAEETNNYIEKVKKLRCCW